MTEREDFSSRIHEVDPDYFPCGCLISTGNSNDGERRILYASRYFTDTLGFTADKLEGQALSTLLTPASGILFDSYVVPILTHEGRCNEVLLDIRAANGGKRPVVVNAAMSGDKGGLIYWSMFDATQRDQLYQELIEVRRRLERMTKELHAKSITDELTGLVNRRELNRRAEVALAQARRNGRPLAVLVLDIDYFKRINDELGHAEGDRILRELGRVLKADSRANDIAARYGGEEFVIVLPESDQSQARRTASRLHAALRRIFAGDRPVTVSIGVSVAHSESLESVTLETLFRQADKALYEAKDNGRDQTVVAENPHFPYPRRPVPPEQGSRRFSG